MPSRDQLRVMLNRSRGLIDRLDANLGDKAREQDAVIEPDKSANGYVGPILKTGAGTRCLLSTSSARKLSFRFREEFRMPLGVRKSPKNEPAVGR